MNKLVFLVLFIAISYIKCAYEADRVTKLPGYGKISGFKMYSGYIQVNEASNRNLFYIFVTSQTNPSTAPLVSWNNGGPSCSSLLGMFVEHGPFRVNSNGKSLHEFDQSWNKIANVLYIEGPAGVGFSYSDNPLDKYTNDNYTAHDQYTFIQNWFSKFPEFRSNPYYISGESYAGHYTTEYMNVILDENAKIDAKIKDLEAYKASKIRSDGILVDPENLDVSVEDQLEAYKASKIRSDGILVGNPGFNSDWYFNVNEFAFVTYMYSHALIPQHAYQKVYDICDWKDFLTHCNKSFTNPTSECTDAANDAVAFIPRNSLDLYDILEPICITDDLNDNFNSTENHSYVPFNRFVNEPFAPCAQNYVHNYLNLPDVQKALHAKPQKWNSCGGVNYGSEKKNMFPLIQRIIDLTPSDFKYTVFSGDADSAVPFIGTQKIMNCLKRDVKVDWGNWFHKKQVGGSVIIYKGISFVTVKGAGHMVPYYKPQLAQKLFEKYLNGDFF